MSDVPNGSDLSKVAGSQFGQLIADQLGRATAVKASLEQRALAVITTSGILVTLVLAFTTLSTVARGLASGDQRSAVALPLVVRVLMIVALIMFVVAVALALSVNNARAYEEIDPDGLDEMSSRQDLWTAPDPVEAARLVAEAQAVMVRRFRTTNGRKAVELRLAMIAELLAVSLLAAAVGVLLFVG